MRSVQVRGARHVACKMASTVRRLPDFRERLVARTAQLAKEFGQSEFVMPVGLFLVLDRKNGGDATAQELARRFKLIDLESRNVIDFYFLGGSKRPSGDLRFDISDFSHWREFFRKRDISEFGGNADLILVDAVRDTEGNVTLNFPEAMRIDLSASKNEKDFPTLGAFLQSIVQTAEAVRHDPQGASAAGFVFSISDRLGLAVAKDSILDFIFDKWGKIVGAKKLKKLCVRNLGPPVKL